MTAVKSLPLGRPFSVDVAGLDVGGDVLDTLRRRSRAVHARGRVAESLYAIALDIFGDDGRLHAAERQWLAEALSAPVSEAAYEAVDTLLRELALAVGAAPSRVRPAIGSASTVTRIDFE